MKSAREIMKKQLEEAHKKWLGKWWERIELCQCSSYKMKKEKQRNLSQVWETSETNGCKSQRSGEL